jgi:hypothetical protein
MPRFIPPPGPGRPKGSKTKQQLAVEAKLEELGCDPITAMATLAIDPATPLELRIKLHRELAQYVAPRRKAAERPIVLDLPPLNGSRDAVAASAALIAAVASGEIAPGEAHDIGRLLEVHLKAVELHDIEVRLAALESKQP